MHAALAMSRLRSNLSLLLLPTLLAASVAARGADLGPILLTSPAAQPLQGLVSLSLGSEESLDDLGVAVGSSAEYGWLEIGRPPWVDDVQVHVTDEEGEARVRLWTTDAPPDRSFSLLLVVSSPAGRSLRQYDVVLRDAEVLLAPAEPQSSGAGDLAVKRPGDKAVADAGAMSGESTAGARPLRRPLKIPARADAEQRRNLSISSANARQLDGALEKRAQRLEEDAAAQRRALNEANTRISDLQGQVEKLEKLLALKAVPPPPEKTASTVAAAAASKTPETPPKAAAGAEKPADPAPLAAPPAETPAAMPAAPAPPASAAAPMVDVEPAAATDSATGTTETTPPATDEVPKPPTDGAKAGQPEDAAEHDDGLASMLMIVGGVVVTLLLATVAAFWWRRRRARQSQHDAAAATETETAHEASAAEDAGALPPVAEPQAADVDAAPPAEPEPVAKAAAIEAVDASIAAALDAPLGDMTPVESLPSTAAPSANVAVATLEAVTAEPPETAGIDDLDALFSEEAIAAAQAAIKATAAAEPEAVADMRTATASGAEAEALEPSATGAPAEPAAEPATEGLLEEEDSGENNNEADLEDVEVNLARAYIDMGDPDGARAILEGMLADPDNPERAALARRTMRRFGLRPGAPPADGAAAGG